jgi:hypothetical protein
MSDGLKVYEDVCAPFVEEFFLRRPSATFPQVDGFFVAPPGTLLWLLWREAKPAQQNPNSRWCRTRN